MAVLQKPPASEQRNVPLGKTASAFPYVEKKNIFSFGLSRRESLE
jgi:hypothetical protein